MNKDFDVDRTAVKMDEVGGRCVQETGAVRVVLNRHCR